MNSLPRAPRRDGSFENTGRAFGARSTCSVERQRALEAASSSLFTTLGALRCQHGFTLVELLVVAVVLAIFAAIVVPEFSNTSDSTRESAAIADLNNIRKAISLYQQQHGGVAPGVTMSASALCPAPGQSSLGGPGTDLALIYQLSRFTDDIGGTCSIRTTRFVYGPYIQVSGVPRNPWTGSRAIRVVTDGNLQPQGAAAANNGGWLYDLKSVRLVFDHEDYDHL
jgi:prepilin-type N-terminal cleavage/methylation domain-containing protein